jgi:hydroxypyruvate isomerase
MAGENRQALAGVGFLKGLLVRWNAKYLATRMQNYSALVTTLGNIVNRRNLQPRPHLLDAARVAALSRETAEVFRGNLEKAARFTAARGARFVHFLQPQVYSGHPRTAYEQSVVDNFYVNPNGLEIAFAAGYPALREAMAGVDLSGILDARSPGEEFYLDFCHVNHAANARIAAAMASALR